MVLMSQEYLVPIYVTKLPETSLACVLALNCMIYALWMKMVTGTNLIFLAALQFVRWLNNQKDSQVIHGVNISISMIHEVASYACGQTPVCDICDKMVSEGMVVVVAAGNQGQCFYEAAVGVSQQGYRTVNITDPGNAESVITVRKPIATVPILMVSPISQVKALQATEDQNLI